MRAARRGRRGSAVLLILLGGCFQVYEPSRLEPGDAGVNDAGVDSGVDGGDIDAGCVGRTPPVRPELPDDGDRSLTFALRELVADPTTLETTWHEFSFDLDATCTYDTDTSSCAGNTVVADGPDGEDNVFGQYLMAQLQEIRGTDIQGYSRTQLNLGSKNPMLHISGWNGLPDDSLVSAWITISAEFEAESGGEEPAWDGSDIFYPRQVDFVEGNIGQPIVVDSAAYVAGGTLVARIPESALLVPQGFGLPEIEVLLREMTVTAEIVEDGARLARVNLIGRWRILDILQALGEAGFCEGSLERNGIEFVVDQFADIRADARSDNMGATCDAISVGVGFAGTPVILGSETRGLPRLGDPCE